MLHTKHSCSTSKGYISTNSKANVERGCSNIVYNKYTLSMDRNIEINDTELQL